VNVREGSGLEGGMPAPEAREAGYVMVNAPASGYAGHVGDRVVVTHRTDVSVYVRFASGMRECYPPLLFAELFAWRPPRSE
jgi:hypothetical protein